MTRQQLRAVVHRIAVTFLEVERGLRPPDQLAAFLTPDAYRRHLVANPATRAVSSPVRPPDVGRVHIDAATPQRVDASVLVRREDDRWSALLVGLQQTDTRWQVNRLDRLERFVLREPRHVEVDDDALAPRIRAVEGERQAVRAAYLAVSRRYERIEDKRLREAKLLRHERDRWGALLEDLNGEAASLGHRQLQQYWSMPSEPHPSATHDAPAAGIEMILGARPDEADQAELWDAAEHALAVYSDRWETGSVNALLRAATSEEQEADRRELLRHLGQVASEMEVSSTTAPEPALNAKARPEPSVSS